LLNSAELTRGDVYVQNTSLSEGMVKALSCAEIKEFGDRTGIWSRDKTDGILKNCVISIGDLIINELNTSGYATR
jgi:hypothetical protein